jgi:hypothetical protein
MLCKEESHEIDIKKQGIEDAELRSERKSIAKPGQNNAQETLYP